MLIICPHKGPTLSSDPDQSHVFEIFPDFSADVRASVTWLALLLCPGRMFRDTSGCAGECGCAAWPPPSRWVSSSSSSTGGPGSASSPAAARALCLWPTFCSWRWEIKWIPSSGFARLAARGENYATRFWIGWDWDHRVSILVQPLSFIYIKCSVYRCKLLIIVLLHF